MKKAIYFLVIVALSASCKNEAEAGKKEAVNIISPDLVEVASNIIYDVVVQTDSDDEWEQEKIAGYSGENMIDNLFEAVYSGALKAFDYHSGAELSDKDIRKIENQEGFERANIGKIQFTENWYYNPYTQSIEKKIVSLVFGYKTPTEDQAGAGYMAAFEIVF